MNEEQKIKPIKQSPSREVNSHSSSQEIFCLLWKSKAYYHVLKTLPLNLILSQMNPVNQWKASVCCSEQSVVVKC